VTLEDYKLECAQMLNDAPSGQGPMPDFFMIIRLHMLYRLAMKGTETERKQCLEHWLTLPVDEKLKKEVKTARERQKR
jgi:hypothetical protein